MQPQKSNYEPNILKKNYINSSIIKDSLDPWNDDSEKRFNLEKLNKSFRESVPILDYLDWRIEVMQRGYSETVLPLNVQSSNQHITHQAALMMLSADYTGGLALASLFHLAPVLGFWEVFDEYAIYMWGAKSKIKWHYPSTDDLICKANIDIKSRDNLIKRMNMSKKVVFTTHIEMYNGKKLVADCDFTYWAQDIHSLRKNILDPDNIQILYKHKLKTTAKLIAGFRALEQENLEPRVKDPFALKIAGKHGLTLAQRFKKNTPQVQDMVIARSKHLDEAVLKFIKGKKKFNIVNIGAGYDDRFIRIDLSKGHIYDLDLPTMLIDRQEIFDYKYNNIQYIPIDLITQNIDEVLLNKKYNFDASIPTFFIWEGGSMYFGKNEIDRIFNAFSKLLNKNNLLWFDYVSTDIIKDKTGIIEIEIFMKSMRIMGEAFINGFDDIKSFAKKYELNVLTDDKSSKLINNNEPHFDYYSFCLLTKNLNV